MIVLDTHAWLWWASDRSRLSTAARTAIDNTDVIAVSAITCWEIATKVARGRLTLDRDVEEWIDDALAVDRRTEVLAVTRAIASRAGRLADGLHGDPADRIIAASAIESRAALVTKDRVLRAWARSSGALRAVW